LKKRNHFRITNRIVVVFFLTLSFIVSCGGSSDEPAIEGPSNLVFEANVIGADATHPFGDGSGMVVFNFSADNATSYKINLGNGEILETSKTTLTYTYLDSGTNTYTVNVSAYNNDQFISTSASISVKTDTSLLWADEFNGSGAPNSANWTHEIGTGSNGWGNGEHQYYTDRLENSKVENGVLKITAKAESYSGSNYTSARLISLNKFEFTYGRIDIRAKLPEGDGTWPALWLLGADIKTVGWPACGEIDIMEHWGFNPGKVSSATHTPACHGGCGNVKVGETTLDDYASEFHVYSMEWSKDELRFLIDDEYKYSYNPSTKNDETWPFNKPHFIILNIAMGASWFDVDPNFVESTMEIDYIRVYK